MNENRLSDWTLGAFKQREEERRRNEHGEPAPVPPNDKMQRGGDALRSDWTIAALHKRFAAMEQRLAALEQREGEQRRKEQAAAAHVPPREEAQRREVIVLGSATLGTTEAPAVAEARIEDEQAEAARRANEQRLQREAAETITRDDRERLESDRIDIRPVRNVETAHAGAAPKMARAFVSFLITALIAGAIGFGAGIYVVPIEKATHFRTLIKRGLDSIYGGRSSPER